MTQRSISPIVREAITARRCSLTALALDAASTALARLAVTASASVIPPGRVRSAHFLVAVKGQQADHWVINHASQSQCDPSISGTGTESWKFASPHAAKYTADSYATSSGSSLFLLGQSIRTSGTVTRHGKVSYGKISLQCGSGLGTGKPPRADCGRHQVANVPLSLVYLRHRRRPDSFIKREEWL